jgi:hypothetical protein
MKKKILSVVLAIAMVFALAAPVLANPGQNPNQNPGAPTVTAGDILVTATGGGNNLVLTATNLVTGEVVVIPRSGNGTFTQTSWVFDYFEVVIQVQGNSLRNVTVTDHTPTPLPVPECVQGCDPALCPAHNAGEECVCACDCYVPSNTATWNGRVNVQGGNNGVIRVTVNGVSVDVRGNFAQQRGTTTVVVGDYSFAVTSNDNNQVTQVVVTSLVPVEVSVVINSVVSLTPGNQQ